MPKKFEAFFVDCESIESEDIVSKNDFRFKIFNPILDLFLRELSARFSSNGPALTEIDFLLPSSNNFLCFSKVQPFAEHYGAVIEALEAVFKLLPRSIELHEKDNKIKIKLIMQFSDFLDIYKKAYNET